MRPKHHIMISVSLGCLVLVITKSIINTFIFIFIGIFLDIDHFFDYFREYGVNLNIRKFINTLCYVNYKRLYLVFHSYELLIPAWIVFYITNEYILGIVITVSFLQHVIMDNIFNKVHPLGYFFIFRAYKRFSARGYFKPYKDRENITY